MGVMNEDRLTLYDGLIKTHITNTTVAKEDGKGLSTNDYTTEEKNKLDGLNDTLLNKLGESTEGSLTYNGNEITSKADSELSTTSENPVQNKIITVKLNEKADSMVYDESNSKLKLMNGEIVLSEVIVSGGGSSNGATIGVLTSESTLIGKEVVLSKDGTTVKTGQFNVSGICTFSGIEETGTYTVTSTDGTDTASNEVTITTDDILNKSILQVTIDFTLDGSTATPLNDVSIWLRTDSTGSSLNAGHTTLTQVIADPNTLNNLMGDLSAMQYLARSTGFADEGCASETFMTYLGASPYVDSTVLNSDLWVDKLKSSEYKLLVSPYQVCAYATASDSDLQNMLTGYYSGWLTIDDIKTKNSVGDTRSVTLSAMKATGVGESHRAQTVQFAIADFDHDTLTTPIHGHSKAAVTLTQVHCLMDAANESNPVNGLNNTENGYMNSTDTNVDGWRSCARRAWCNNVFYNALPDTIRNIVKEVDKLTSAGNKSTTIITTSDKVFLLSEIEVFGGTNYSVAGEGSQYTYYKITSNRYKNPKWNSEDVSSYWAERSPGGGDDTSCFCHVRLNGVSSKHLASEVEGITVSFCL